MEIIIILAVIAGGSYYFFSRKNKSIIFREMNSKIESVEKTFEKISKATPLFYKIVRFKQILGLMTEDPEKYKKLTSAEDKLSKEEKDSLNDWIEHPKNELSKNAQEIIKLWDKCKEQYAKIMQLWPKIEENYRYNQQGLNIPINDLYTATLMLEKVLENSSYYLNSDKLEKIVDELDLINRRFEIINERLASYSIVK